MTRRFTWNRIAQCVVVLLCALSLKLYYSSATADQLRWILAPTTAVVQVINGVSFEFESHSGYLSSDRGFLIANSCAGVNFLITAFLMLSMRKLLVGGSKQIAWGFLTTSALTAYLVTVFANAARISIALRLQGTAGEICGLNPAQLHRVEGIVVYFGFLLLLFVVSERMNPEKTSGLFREFFFPLLVYYGTAIGIPLANGAYRKGSDFWEHSLFVLLIPLLFMIPLAAFRIYRQSRCRRSPKVPPSAGPLLACVGTTKEQPRISRIAQMDHE